MGYFKKGAWIDSICELDHNNISSMSITLDLFEMQQDIKQLQCDVEQLYRKVRCITL